MKQAPFNITLILGTTYLLVALAGGILAAIFGAYGVDGFWGLFLTIFLVIPFGRTIRSILVSNVAQEAGSSERPPEPFSFPIRLIVVLVVAAAIAYPFSQSTFYTFGFLQGFTAALLAVMLLSVVFFVKVSFFTK